MKSYLLTLALIPSLVAGVAAIAHAAATDGSQFWTSFLGGALLSLFVMGVRT